MQCSSVKSVEVLDLLVKIASTKHSTRLLLFLKFNKKISQNRKSIKQDLKSSFRSKLKLVNKLPYYDDASYFVDASRLHFSCCI